MTIWFLTRLVRLLPVDTREEVLRELLEQQAAIRRTRGAGAAFWWLCRQPLAIAQWRQGADDARWYAGLGEDLMITQRALRRRPALGLTVVATIAVCVAAVTAVASIVDAVMLRPLPFPEADRLVWLASHERAAAAKPFDPALAASAYSNPMDVVDWARRERHLTALTPFETFEGTIDVGGTPRRVGLATVNASVGAVLGIRPVLGRLFTEADYPRAGKVLLMSHRLWQSAFGADPAIVGRVVYIGGDPVEVVGVLPPMTPAFPAMDSDIWFPLRPPPETFQNRGGVWQRVVARIDRDVTVAQAGDDMARIARELAAEYPDSNGNRHVYVVPYRDGLVGTTRRVVSLMVGAVALVLLIACANIGNLLLVNAQSRQRELAVRAALGARSSRLARLLIVETLWLAVAGGVVGLLLAPWCLRGFLQLYPETLPAVGTVDVRLTAVLVAAGATLLTAVLAVIPPLMMVTSRQLQDTMRSGERGSEHRSQRHTRAALVVAQVALSTALLVGGGLLVRTFVTMKGTAPGFETTNVLTFNLALGELRYPDLPAEVRFYDDLLSRVRALPGVTAAGTTTLLPLTSGEFADGFFRVGENDVYPKIPVARLQAVSDGYFEAVGLPVRKGRAFTSADAAGSRPVVIVNDALERRDFPAGAVGRQIRFRGVIHDIVGVVGDKHHRSLREVPRAEMYYPRAQIDNPRYFGWVAIRAEGDPRTLVGPVRDIVSAIDPAVAIDEIDTMDARVDRALAPDRFRAVLVGALAATALLLAGLGLYGLITHAVARDARATAIRMALGATGRDAVTRVLVHILTLSGIGAVLGGALAYAGHTLVAGFLAGVDRFDPITLTGVVALLLTVTVSAACGPAIRASRVDPADVLRSQ